MAPFEIVWQAPEFEYREKSVSWYWISIIVAALLIAFAVWERNILFGFFIVVAEILFIVWGNQAPRSVDFMITEHDLQIGSTKRYSLKEFESISVDQLDDEWSELIFQFHARLKTPLKMLFPESRLQELRTELKTILKEVPYEPTFLDSIEKLLHF